MRACIYEKRSRLNARASSRPGDGKQRKEEGNELVLQALETERCVRSRTYWNGVACKDEGEKAGKVSEPPVEQQRCSKVKGGPPLPVDLDLVESTARTNNPFAIPVRMSHLPRTVPSPSRIPAPILDTSEFLTRINPFQCAING